MSLIGNMIIIGCLTFGGSIAIVATIKHLAKPPRMKIVLFEEPADAPGDWVTTAAEFPSSGALRKEPEPRGM